MYLAQKQLYTVNRVTYPLLLQKQQDKKPKEWFEDPLEPLLEEMKKMSSGLLPFEERLKEFYDRDTFINFLISDVDWRLIESWEEYQAYFDAKTDEELKRNLLDILLKGEGEVEDDAKRDELLLEYVSNQFALLDALNQMPMKDARRWAYFNAVMNPRKLITDFFALHEEILPVFEDVYQKYEDILIKEYSLFEETMRVTPTFFNDAFSGEFSIDADAAMVIPVLSLTDFIGLVVEKDKQEIIFLGGKFVESVQLLVDFHKNQQTERISIFKNLGDPTRYGILCQIAAGVKSVKQIAASLSITSATVNYHINQMLISNLVSHDWNDKTNDNPINTMLLTEALRGLEEDLQLKL